MASCPAKCGGRAASRLKLMKIPIRYNIGSLWTRRTGTAMTILGISLTVSIFIIMLALVNGMDATYVETGHPHQLIVLRQGSLTEVNSYFDQETFPAIRFLPGVARNARDEPLVSGELVVVINHARISGETSNITIRGLADLGFALRPEIELVQGRKFRPGLRELMVSESISNRFQDMRMGDTVSIAKSRWKIVGIFSAGGSAYDSEVLAHYSEIAEDWDRVGTYSSVLLKAEDDAAVKDIVRRVADDQRINLQAIEQGAYFEDQTSTSMGVRALSYFIAIVMGIGACFAAMNTMYGMVMARSREIGTLRAIGFRSRSILASFMVESVILSLAGGVLGCLLALPIHGITTGTANFQTFSELLFSFRITPAILTQGLIFAVLVGTLGGYLPARRAAHQVLVDVMRD